MQDQRLRINGYAIRLHSLYAGGLLAISLIILQDFLGLGKLDLAALVSVVAFAAAIPLLSGMLVANVVQSKYRYSPALSRAPRVVESAFYLGILFDCLGIGAAFWHASVIAAIVFMVMVAISGLIYSVYIFSLSDESMVGVRRERESVVS
jgi:hypothetical protein